MLISFDTINVELKLKNDLNFIFSIAYPSPTINVFNKVFRGNVQLAQFDRSYVEGPIVTIWTTSIGLIQVTVVANFILETSNILVSVSYAWCFNCAIWLTITSIFDESRAIVTSGKHTSIDMFAESVACNQRISLTNEISIDFIILKEKVNLFVSIFGTH